jgi:hypothetical protein
MPRLGCLVVATCLVGCGAVPEGLAQDDEIGSTDSELKPRNPNGRRLSTIDQTPLSEKRDNWAQFRLHHGPVMVGPVNLYLIWYGTWTGSAARTVVTDVAQNIGTSSYYEMITTYRDDCGTPLSTGAVLAGEAEDLYSLGSTLSESEIQQVISNAITNGSLPADPNGVYYVLTSADVIAESGQCVTYCAFHNYFDVGTTRIKYAYVGDANRCPDKCAPQALGPNGPSGGDAMASLFAAMLFSTQTDPTFNAYYDRRGFEASDKCAWTYGATYLTENGAKANVKIGERDYLIQQNWVRAWTFGYCALGLP